MPAVVMVVMMTVMHREFTSKCMLYANELALKNGVVANGVVVCVRACVCARS